MRTKSIVLTAAALAAGLLPSMAQSNVYSVNIVGYVNRTNPVNAYIQLANPLDNGTNDIVSLFPTAPNGTTISVLSGGVLQTSLKSKGTWSSNFLIPPGTGFFLKNPNLQTNTFVGSTPLSNSVVLPNGVTVFSGSMIPFAGNLNDAVASSNALNLNVLPNGSTVSILDGAGALQTSLKSKGTWSQNFSIGVAQGFYIKAGAATTWTQVVGQ